MIDPPDIEILAAAEHESWSGWMFYMMPKIEREMLDRAKSDQELVDAFAALNELPCVKRWVRQMNTPYAELPEAEKESDRREARKKFKVYRPSSESELRKLWILVSWCLDCLAPNRSDAPACRECGGRLK